MSTQDHSPLDAEHSDAAFEDYLRRDTDISKQYSELDSGAVPPALNVAILSQAHAAASATRRSRILRWSAPLALAASVVVVISLVMQPSVRRAASTNAMRVLEPSPKIVAPEERNSGKQERDAADKSMSGRLTQEMRAPSPLAIEEAPALETKQRSAGAASESEDSRAIRFATPPAVEAAPSSPAPLNAIRPSTMQAPAAPEPPAEVSQAKRVDPGAASAEELKDITVTARRREAQAAQVAGPRGTIQGVSGDSTASNEKTEREGDAALWLDYIRRLRRDDRARAADREWERFVDKYPHYQVAADDLARPRE